MKTLRNTKAASWQAEADLKQQRKASKQQRNQRKNKRIIWSV